MSRRRPLLAVGSARLWAAVLCLGFGVLTMHLAGCATTPPSADAAMASPVSAHDRARAAYAVGDYPAALAILGPRAYGGDPFAQYTLGYMYYYGQGLPADETAARHWIGRAAEQGYAKAGAALRQLGPTPAGRQRTAVVPDATEVTVSPEPPAVTAAPVVLAPAPEPTAPVIVPAPPARVVVPARPRTVDADAPAQQLPAVPVSAPPATDAPAPMRDAAWVARQAPDHYTIQLLGSRSEQRARQFIEDSGLSAEAAYFASTWQGQPWYSVVYGSFPGYRRAQAALDGLLPALRSDEPWIRRFGAVHEQLSVGAAGSPGPER